MNTGLQDAHNLACKINDVLTGVAAESYLDRYGAERRPVAQRLVSTTDAMFGVITSDRTVPRLIRSSVVRYLAPIVASFVPRLVRSSRIFEYLSQTRIHYWMSEGARRASHGRRGKVVGRRLPWNGDNYDSLRGYDLAAARVRPPRPSKGQTARTAVRSSLPGLPALAQSQDPQRHLLSHQTGWFRRS